MELFLNGKSLGTLPKPVNDSPREWDVTFEKGTIKAIGRIKGKEVASEEFKSAGAPARVVLTSNQSKLTKNWDDVSFITATIVDANGAQCPNSDNLIKFSISGPGVIAAVDNGNIISHEPYQATERQAYQGKAIAIIKASEREGKIIFKAQSEGLEPATITVNVAP